MLNKIFKEPCLETLKRMQDKSIDCVITSPPYWQLRDYGYDGQWGLEPTFQEYLQHLWQLIDEIYRVLKDEGTCWVNLGDTYNKQDKCLLLIPHRFAIGCINRGWILRNDIIWAKPNGMPESVTDRFTKKHEYIFFMVKSEKYYFNLDSIRDKLSNSSIKRYDYDWDGNQNRGYTSGQQNNMKKYLSNNDKKQEAILKGKNPGSVSDFWDITTKSSSDTHYASYNTDLIKKPILAGCPERGVIYDPFMGTGTTAVAALRANRNFIGSEMSEEYIKICNANIEPYLKQIELF